MHGFRKQLLKHCRILEKLYFGNLEQVFKSAATEMGLPRVGNQKKALKDSEKKLYFGNLEQVFKSAATDLSTKPTTRLLRLTCAIKNAGFLRDACCRLRV